MKFKPLFFCRNYLLSLLPVVLSISVNASEIEDVILPTMQPKTITIIGETHKRPESTQLFKSVVRKFLKQGKCLTVALEIASSQQAVLEKEIVSNIKIPTIIDHPAFREMIAEFIQIKQDGGCLTLLAIDADMKNSSPRDKWMAKILSSKLTNQPIIVLLGNLHALKRVDWNFKNDQQYVAEILSSSHHNIKTYLQIWDEDKCNYRAHFISPDGHRAVDLINKHITSVLNAYEYKSVLDVTDGIFLWECQ